MENISDKILSVGVIALVSLSGIMAIIFVNYIKSLIGKIDNVSHIEPLISKVENLVDKVEKIFTSLEVMKETSKLEYTQLKERVAKLEELVDKLQEERG
jgi:cell shape-determining protein MreC